MKVAAVQFRARKGDWEGSASALAALVERAAAAGAGLVVCPEMALTGYLFPDEATARRVAEPAQGRTLLRFAPLARRLGVHLVIGYPEDGGARLYNAALVIDPDGALRCNYRKRLLYEADLPWASPGDLPYPLVDTPCGTMAVGICMDLNDDRFIRFLQRTRPRVVAFCTNWIHQGFDIRPYWRERLGGLRSYFVAANSYGVEEEGDLRAHFLGRSAVLGPDGRTLALAPEVGDGVLVAPLVAPVE